MIHHHSKKIDRRPKNRGIFFCLPHNGTRILETDDDVQSGVRLRLKDITSSGIACTVFMSVGVGSRRHSVVPGDRPRSCTGFSFAHVSCVPTLFEFDSNSKSNSNS